jgi:hypothetical protein
VHQRVQRLDQHALRVARRPYRLQLSIANPVVHRPPRHAEQRGSLVNHHRSQHTDPVAQSVPRLAAVYPTADVALSIQKSH